MSKEIKLSETEEKLYNFIKESGGSVRMFDVINHEDKKLIGAVGKLKSYGLVTITRKFPKEEPNRDYRKIIVLNEKKVEEDVKKESET